MKKRLIAFCLVFCMLLTMLPMAVFAADTENTEIAEIQLAAEVPDDTVAVASIAADGVCGPELIWSLDEEGVLYIAGSGNMDAYTLEKPAPWNEYKESITKVILGDEVTGIGAYAFYGLNKLTEVEFSDTVIAIGEAAFCNCEALAEVQLPEGCTSIGENAFSGTLWIADSDASEGEVQEPDPEAEAIEQAPDPETGAIEQAPDIEAEKTEQQPAEEVVESQQIDTSDDDAEDVILDSNEEAEESAQIAPKGSNTDVELGAPTVVTAPEAEEADDEEAEAVELASSASSLSNPRVVSDSSMTAGKRATWDCIWFGSYPQAEVVSSKAMMTAAIDEAFLDSNDYIVDENLYKHLKAATNWNANNEITLGGNKYRRIQEADATYSERGSYCYYDWSDSTTYHYFKYQPIKWRVLSTDGSTALLLADECLDDIIWNSSTNYGNTWKTSQMRSWLNSYGAGYNTAGTNYSSTGFLSNAFTSAEKSAIVNGTVKNNVTGNYTDGSGTATTDRIFLLSRAESIKAAYGFSTNYEIDDEARLVRASTYARARGTFWCPYSAYFGYSWWWLRSAGSSSSYACEVSRIDCGNSYYDHVYDDYYGVRPALNINLSSSCWSYAGTVSSNGTVAEQQPSTSTGPTITKQPVNVSAKVDATAKFSVTASGSGLKYQWQFSTDNGKTWANSPATGNTTNTVSITVAANKNGYLYRCMVTDSNKKSVPSSSAKLTVLPAITKQPAAVSAKVGATAKFSITATGSGLKYQWQFSTDSGQSWANSPAEGNTTATVSISVAANKNGYLYRCMVTDSNGKSIPSSSAKLTVLPAITKQPAAASAKVGATVKFSVTATGVGLKYQWQFSTDNGSTWANSPAEGNTTNTVSIAVAANKNGYLYRCVVTDSNKKSVTSSSAKLTVLPAITKQPSNVSAKVGATAKFTVTATGVGLKYQWQFSTDNGSTWANSPAEGNTTNTVSIYVTDYKNGYLYRCMVTDSNKKSIPSSAAKLTVLPAITKQPSNVSAKVGATAKFTVTATGVGLKYQWQYSTDNGKTWANSPATGNTTNTVSISVAANKNGYLYRCVVTDSNKKSVISKSAKLTVT